MSAESCLVFFGIRFEITADQIGAFEHRSASLIQSARSAGLQHFWANFDSPNEKYYGFVGYALGIMGGEHAVEVILAEADLRKTIEETKIKLCKAQIDGEPRLYIQCLPDA